MTSGLAGRGLRVPLSHRAMRLLGGGVEKDCRIHPLPQRDE
jgi:hypothetical protein